MIAPPLLVSPAGVSVTTDVTCFTTVVGGCDGSTGDGATYVVEASAVMTEIEGANVVVEA